MTIVDHAYAPSTVPSVDGFGCLYRERFVDGTYSLRSCHRHATEHSFTESPSGWGSGAEPASPYDEPTPCPECGIGDAEYSEHEADCPSGYPVAESFVDCTGDAGTCERSAPDLHTHGAGEFATGPSLPDAVFAYSAGLMYVTEPTGDGTYVTLTYATLEATGWRSGREVAAELARLADDERARDLFVATGDADRIAYPEDDGRYQHFPTIVD
jgi:hypothetical protein